MGCDIHLYVEQRQADGSWRCLAPPERDLARWPEIGPEGRQTYSWGPFGCMGRGICDGPDYDGCLGGRCAPCMGTGRDLRWYSKRNYEVFAMLAGVRNRWGVRSIAAPRGMPADVSSVVADHHAWDHTPTWIALPEVLGFDWTQAVVMNTTIPFFESNTIDGFMDCEYFLEWAKTPSHRPRPGWGYRSGGDIVEINEAEARNMLGILTPEDIAATFAGKRLIVRISWTETTYAEAAEDFLAFVETFLRPLGDPERIRLVFGFDS